MIENEVFWKIIKSEIRIERKVNIGSGDEDFDNN
jgi:hypothetical protein